MVVVDDGCWRRRYGLITAGRTSNEGPPTGDSTIDGGGIVLVPCLGNAGRQTCGSNTSCCAVGATPAAGGLEFGSDMPNFSSQKKEVAEGSGGVK